MKRRGLVGGERDAVDERAVAPMVPDARPRALRRRAQRPEDARQLVLDRAAREQRTAREHLEEDTSNAPANSSASYQVTNFECKNCTV